MSAAPPGFQHGPHEVPKKESPPILTALIVASVAGCIVLVIAFFGLINIFSASFRKVSETMAREREDRTVSVRFEGPDPWKPGPSGRYELKRAGFSLELPFEPVANHAGYTEEAAQRLPGVFNYDVSADEKVGIVYGLRSPKGEEPVLEGAQWVFESMYVHDESSTNSRVQSHIERLKGREVQRISISFDYFGDRWHMEGVAFVGGDYLCGVGFSDLSQHKAKARLERVLRTIQWSVPTRQQD